MRHNIKFNEQHSIQKLNEYLTPELAPSEVNRFLSSITHKHLSAGLCLVNTTFLLEPQKGKHSAFPSTVFAALQMYANTTLSGMY